MSDIRLRHQLNERNGCEIQGNISERSPKNESDVTKKDRLCNLEEMPEYLRFNPFIKEGYRRQMSLKECCQSLFFFHNESVNVYTHAISGILMLFWIPHASTSSINENYTIYILHYIGCISPFIGSTIYHLFMCHSSGHVTYDWLLKFDMLGIWAINTFGGITAINATLFCFKYYANIFIIMYILTAIFILYFVLTAKNVKERFIPLLLFGVFRYSVLSLRGIMLYYNYAAGSSSAIIYYILMDLAALTGGILNVTRFPERYILRKLDYCCNSHNIMHVVVTLSPILLHWGTMLDFNWMENYQC